MRFAAWIAIAACTAAAQPRRGLSICVSANAPEPVRAAASEILRAVPRHPLLRAMAAESAPESVCASEELARGPVEARAYRHLVIAGLADDPVIHAAWQHEARIEAGGLYVFGFGHLTGDIGYIESGRNPFLHSAAIAKAPFETGIVAITGSSARGVVLAVRAFLDRSIVNGVVAAPGWQRGAPNLLERDPLDARSAAPEWLPKQTGDYSLIGITQAAEDEYRGVLADTGVEPREIWRAKYYRAGAWDGEGEAHAFDHYAAGLHRRAYGNTVWVARFASAAEAASAAPRIAAAAKLRAEGSRWTGRQPPYASGTYAGETDSAGPLLLWLRDSWIVMSTVPGGAW